MDAPDAIWLRVLETETGRKEGSSMKCATCEVDFNQIDLWPYPATDDSQCMNCIAKERGEWKQRAEDNQRKYLELKLENETLKNCITILHSEVKRLGK